MNIALIGYGKMGKTIEQVALRRGHTIVAKITSTNRQDIGSDLFKTADVAIEFTRPEAAQGNVSASIETGVPVVCGTTGWNDGVAAIHDLVSSTRSAFLHASNFSIGVNIFFEVNKLLASLMDNYPDYQVTIEETHHTQKKDAPSGTAITLAEQVIGNMDRLSGWGLNVESNDLLPITAHRIENVPGTHLVKYSSAIDDIEIIHTAHNRDGFALGAVLAAEFMKGRQGVFSMNDVLFRKPATK